MNSKCLCGYNKNNKIKLKLFKTRCLITPTCRGHNFLPRAWNSNPFTPLERRTKNLNLVPKIASL